MDINAILPADSDRPLLEKIYQLRIDEAPTDDKTMEKDFTGTVRKIKEKWYKDQHRQLKLRLAQAQASGDQDLSNKLLYEKENILMKERELR